MIGVITAPGDLLLKLEIPSLNLPPWTFTGSSVAGIATSLVVEELGLCFDIAVPYEPFLPIKNFLITHGHLDHSAGIPYTISQKTMNKHPIATFYMPQALVEPLDAIMKTWQQLEKHEYQYQFIAAQPGQEYSLKGHYFFRPFQTIHRIPSQGYTIFERKKKLKPGLQNLPRTELEKMRKNGQVIDDITERPVISFTGDTQIEFLDNSPWPALSTILFVEVSFLDEKKSVEETRHWGHLHLDELIPRLPEIKSEKIVLIHISQRYRWHEIMAILKAKVPNHELDRITVLSRAKWSSEK